MSESETWRDDLTTIVEWARFSAGATEWRDVEATLAQPAPEDVRDAMERLRDIELAQHAGEPPLDVLSEWRQGLDERELDILTQRLLKLGSKRTTLDEIGQSHGVTRERVRQLEGRMLARFRRALHQPRFRTVRWALFQLELGLGAFAPETEVPFNSESDEADSFRLLLHVSGYVHDAATCAIRRDGYRLPHPASVPLVGDGPIIDEVALKEDLEQEGVAEQHLSFAISRVAGIKRLEGQLVLWPRNMAHKGVAVLAVRERPMTPNEIADVIAEGFNRRGFRDRLFQDERVSRSSRHHVALRSWELPEYGGVVPSMIERLQDGPAALDELAQELASSFGVSPNSVMMYSAAPVFRTSKGQIELRSADDPYIPINAPWKVPGLYRHDSDRLAWHVRIDRDVLRGSGRAVPDEIGIFLGGGPPMAVKLKHAEKETPLAWAETSHVGPHIGSIREIALANGGDEGDLLRLVFDRADLSISASLVDTSPAGDPPEVLARLTGLGAPNVVSRAAFAESLGVSDEDPVAVLRARDDHSVADLVDRLPAR